MQGVQSCVKYHQAKNLKISHSFLVAAIGKLHEETPCVFKEPRAMHTSNLSHQIRVVVSKFRDVHTTEKHMEIIRQRATQPSTIVFAIVCDDMYFCI